MNKDVLIYFSSSGACVNTLRGADVRKNS